MKWFVIIVFSINAVVFLDHTVFSASDVVVESLVSEGQVPGLKLLSRASSLTLLSTQLPSDKHHVVQKNVIDSPQLEEYEQQVVVEETHQQAMIDDFSLAVSSAVTDDTQRLASIDYQCFEVGPFEQEKIAIIIQDRLFEFRLGSRTEERIRKTFVGFLIYLPISASVSLARLKLEALKMHGLTNVTRIAGDGKLKNAISLGVYNQQDRALKRAESIRGLGFSPQTQERSQLHEEIWVVLKTDIHRTLTELQWQQVLADYESISVKAMPCA